MGQKTGWCVSLAVQGQLELLPPCWTAAKRDFPIRRHKAILIFSIKIAGQYIFLLLGYF
ncbi:hypothetical protein [Rhodomicrobium vannielii]|uniref:hypothetical protein n=1 Tax=Rhodomicrobium vannielii TaxID=1069 RepID=UPI001FEE0682|nr:hypothetical protein [Rhodomicrobium vannielii]